MATEKQFYMRFIKYIAVLSLAAGCAQIMQGNQYIIDGDTIKIGKESIRLVGIDAPETDQPCVCGGKKVMCGQEATAALVEFVGESQIYCKTKERDCFGRIVGECFIRREEKEISINRWMVRNGHAIDYTNFVSMFEKEEQEAKAEKTGIWRCEGFQIPAEYRRERRRAAEKAGTTVPKHLPTPEYNP